MRVALPLAALVLVTSCVGPPRPAPAPAPAVTYTPYPPPPPPPPPRPAGDWQDWPATPGDWSYRRTSDGPEASFGTAREPILTLYCDTASRRVLLTLRSWFGMAAAVTIRTSTLARAMPESPASGGPSSATTPAGSKPGWTSTFAVSDPLLDAVAFSRGRFLIDRPGRPLVVPVYAEIGRVIEECRR